MKADWRSCSVHAKPGRDSTRETTDTSSLFDILRFLQFVSVNTETIWLQCLNFISKLGMGLLAVTAFVICFVFLHLRP